MFIKLCHCLCEEGRRGQDGIKRRAHGCAFPSHINNDTV